jgi:hypothetical protein
MRLGKYSIQHVTKWLLAATLATALIGITAPRAAASSTPILSTSGYPTPGNTLTISGARFIPNGVATIYYDSTQIATVPVRQMLGIVGLYVGGFQISYTIPFTTTIGAHTLQAVEQPGNLTAQTSITVAASWAQYGFSPTNTRFNPYETSISLSNVSSLTLAWSYSSAFQFDTPVVENGDINFTNLNETIFAKNATTGASVWSYNTLFPVGSDAPAVYNGTLYAGGYYLYAVNTATGTQSWMSSGNIDNYPTTVADGFVYADYGGELMAYNAEGCVTGSCTPIWTLPGAIGGPAVSGNMLYAAGGGGLLVADATTGKVAWTGAIATSDRYPGSPVVDGGYVFLASAPSINNSTSTLYAFNASGCGQATCSPLWTASIQEGDGYAAGTGLAVANNTVFVNGYGLYAFPEGGCGASTCSPSWIGQTNSPGQTGNWMIDSAPAIANGLVYVGADDDSVRAFDVTGCDAASTCAPVWNLCATGATCAPTVAGHFGSPVVINGMLYIAMYGGTLYAFGLPSATARQARNTSAPSASKASAPHAHTGAAQWSRPSIARPGSHTFMPWWN